jgi:hypothetical protein
MIPIERSCHKEHTYEIPITYHSKDISNVKVFEKWVKLQCFVIRSTHMKYESPTTYHSKDISNVKVFGKWVKLQGQEVKSFVAKRSCHKKHKYESPITNHSKYMANVKVLADRQTDRPKNICPPPPLA